MIRWLLCFFLCPMLLFCNEEHLVRRVYAHLTIKDERAALKEAEEALVKNPSSKILQAAHIKVLAILGHEEDMLLAWKSYCTAFPEADQHELIEAMAWGIIQNGAKSSSPIIRIFSTLAAFYANDARSIGVICRSLSDNNRVVRQVAVDVAADMRDAKLCDKILDLIQNEPDWSVRVSAIRTAGNMKLFEAEPYLLSRLSDGATSLEEKAAATEALVALLDDVNRNEIERLFKSNRAELRALSAGLVSHLNKSQELDLMLNLLKDSQADVRKSALFAIGNLRVKEIEGRTVSESVRALLQDKNPEVAIAASWVMTLNEPDCAEKVFTPWLEHEKRRVRILAASALAATGKWGFPFTLKAFKQAEDPYVKMNLAMSLIAERVEPELGLDALYDGLTNLNERWMKKDFGQFSALAPSDVKYKEEVPHYPEVVNQLTRLEILNMLAIMRHPHADAAIQNFLKERSWGITGFSSALLLTEGDESALKIIRNLLHESAPKIKIQAALILSSWGNDSEALETLKESYTGASRELKEQILEALGNIGEGETLPFLTEKLGESFQSLRLIAASSILKCLYN